MSQCKPWTKAELRTLTSQYQTATYQELSETSLKGRTRNAIATRVSEMGLPPKGGLRTDDVGKKYGRLKVDHVYVDRVNTVMPNGRTTAVVTCKCGTRKVVSATNVRSGRTTSCGCKNRERQQQSGDKLWRWTKYELKLLKKKYRKYTPEQMTQFFPDRTANAIRNKMAILGLHRRGD